MQAERPRGAVFSCTQGREFVSFTSTTTSGVEPSLAALAVETRRKYQDDELNSVRELAVKAAKQV